MNGFVVKNDICQQCNGLGVLSKNSNSCETCNGNGFYNSKQSVEFIVKRGAKNGDTHVIKNIGDQSFKMEEDGDFIIHLKEKQHGLFRRSKNDLILTLNITLMEALTKSSWKILFLDKRLYELKLPNS